jgi:hypothetical protein
MKMKYYFILISVQGTQDSALDLRSQGMRLEHTSVKPIVSLRQYPLVEDFTVSAVGHDHLIRDVDQTAFCYLSPSYLTSESSAAEGK